MTKLTPRQLATMMHVATDGDWTAESKAATMTSLSSRGLIAWNKEASCADRRYLGTYELTRDGRSWYAEWIDAFEQNERRPSAAAPIELIETVADSHGRIVRVVGAYANGRAVVEALTQQYGVPFSALRAAGSYVHTLQNRDADAGQTTIYGGYSYTWRPAAAAAEDYARACQNVADVTAANLAMRERHAQLTKWRKSFGPHQMPDRVRRNRDHADAFADDRRRSILRIARDNRRRFLASLSNVAGILPGESDEQVIERRMFCGVYALLPVCDAYELAHAEDVRRTARAALVA